MTQYPSLSDRIQSTIVWKRNQLEKYQGYSKRPPVGNKWYNWSDIRIEKLLKKIK